jgi:serine/threonine-protein kinase
VYLAEDLKHGRPVAVKVIRPELAASLGRGRFLREIGIAARLRHPSIMPLFDSGDADGLLYFVMPYENGLSLRQRLNRDGRVDTADAISILRNVARALAYAHEQGVVHRDVKPDNVLLSGNAAVVTDFGIAKAFSVALGETDVDDAGDSVIGTPAYMSPEQSRGDPATDHRADLYSFGCLAYEVFTGELPFGGSTTLELAKAQRSETSAPVIEGRADIPPNIARLIALCLATDPAGRPQSAAELIEVLGAVPSLEPLRRRPRLVSVVTLMTLSIVAIVAAAVVFMRQSGRGDRVTVAVLPLQSTAADSSQARLAAGFGDNLAVALVRIPWLRVMSRQGAATYLSNETIDPRVTGRILGARFLVTGSLRQLDGRWTISAKLVSSEDGSVLWADEFDRPTELAALRDQIATTIGDSLRPKAGGSFRRQVIAPRVRRSSSDDAYVLALVGKRELSQRNQDVRGSMGHFRQALDLDSLSPEAWSGLSLTLALLPFYSGVAADSMAPIAIRHARRALQLDPNLAEPHVALGLVLSRNLQWERAEAELKTAIDIDPHDVEARVQYGRLLIFRGRLAEGLRELETARDDDPASALVLSWLSFARYVGGQMDSALVESARAMRSNPSSLTAICFRAMILAAAGQHAEARRLLSSFPRYNPLGLYALAVAGDAQTVRARLDSIAKSPTPTPLANTALAFAMLGLGDTAQALDALERATASREIWSALHPVSSRVFDGVRGSARFDALLARVGLTERDDLPSRRRAALARASLADRATVSDAAPLSTIQWNRKAIALFLVRGGSALRANAYLALAQYRAILTAQDAPGPTRPSLAAAAAGASVVVLKQVFPLDAAALDSLLGAQRDAAVPGNEKSFAAGEAIGRMVGSATSAYAATDNFTINSPGAPPLGSGRWVSSGEPILRAAYGARPFFLRSGSELRLPPPPRYGSPAFAAALAEVRAIAERRTAEQTAIAEKWVQFAGVIFNGIATDLLVKHHRSELEAARILAYGNTAAFDALIACFDTKYAYWFIRPTQADPRITLAVPLPNHPSYPSAHSCETGAWQGVLESAFPSERAMLAATATEASMARIYGGLHYRFDGEGGLTIGRSAARLALERRGIER